MKRPYNSTRIGATRHTRASLVMLLLCAMTLGTGCELLGLDGGSTPAQNPAQPPPTQTPPVAKAPPVAEPEKAEEEEYQRPEYPENVRRNPFAPSNDVLMPILGPNPSDDDGTPQTLEPLQQYNIAQLELVAIISEIAIPKAMFTDPEGFGHVIKEGDRIGRQGGTVVDIRDNEVDVREISGDEDEKQSRVMTIRLRSAELKSAGGDDLSEAERDALERLLDTEEGRNALRRNLKDRAAGANAIEGGGVLPPSSNGGGGVAPPQ